MKEQITNPCFLEKAEALKPNLLHTAVKPVSLLSVYKYRGEWRYKKQADAAELPTRVLKKGDRVCLDFGDHCVGFVRFTVSPTGNHQDAPAHLRLKFGEHICEIGEKSEDYRGGLSSAWIQEEFLHLDVLPCTVELPRRYAFRFLEIFVKDTSANFQIRIDEVECDSVSSADAKAVKPLTGADAELMLLDRISVKTLQDCMQDVFEDGPKRDRRLWIGDLRLQALANYETFGNLELVRRCLYLFAGVLQPDGRIGSCLFTLPRIEVDHVAFLDYSLFFISCLHDYYMQTQDKAIVAELWDVAFSQLALAEAALDPNGVFDPESGFCFFLDWKDGLDKQAGGQGVMLYTAKQARVLAELLGDTERLARIDELIEKLTAGALRLFDDESGLFISGEARQLSWVSQIWMVLSGVFSKEENRALLCRLIEADPPMGMATPYAYHHFIEALLLCGMKEEALSYLRYYWGSMAKEGADCFWEIWNPENKAFSPYGSRVINSYCHAWSGTPSYFIRKYFAK